MHVVAQRRRQDGVPGSVYRSRAPTPSYSLSSLSGTTTSSAPVPTRARTRASSARSSLPHDHARRTRRWRHRRRHPPRHPRRSRRQPHRRRPGQHRFPGQRLRLSAPAGLRPPAGPGRRCWALEGIGSYGAGLADFLDQAGEQVVEACRPKRAANRGGRKTDMLDAIRAAKEALATEHLIQPRLRGEREALRVLLATRHGAVLASTAAINQLKALIVSAPDELRSELRKLKRPDQIAYCAQFRDRPAQDLEHRMTVRAMRSTAQRIQALQAEAKELENEILALVRQQAPQLLGLLGAGLTRGDSARKPPSPPSPPSLVFRRSLPRPG
ncbi:transposase [Streptomyces sp. NPDC047082]|uniref:IS110 family transposase n=1 Tax=Streptomyces sp. NPDC047082 TaxID=3155259 RepID=UPI0033E26828